MSPIYIKKKKLKTSIHTRSTVLSVVLRYQDFSHWVLGGLKMLYSYFLHMHEIKPVINTQLYQSHSSLVILMSWFWDCALAAWSVGCWQKRCLGFSFAVYSHPPVFWHLVLWVMLHNGSGDWLDKVTWLRTWGKKIHLCFFLSDCFLVTSHHLAP